MGAISLEEVTKAPETPQSPTLKLSASNQWRQTSPTTYTRPLDPIESFFNIIHTAGAELGLQHWALSAGIKVRTASPTFISDLRDIWATLRYNNPIIACEMQDGQMTYRVPGSASELSQWLEATFIVHPTATSARELYGETARPFTRVVCHVLPLTQEILLQGTHAHLDGLGTVTLFDNLLRLLATPSSQRQKPNFGDEAKNLLPPLSTITNAPLPTSNQIERWKQDLNAWVGAMPTRRLDTFNTDRAPGRSRVTSLAFTPASTSAIIAASRKKNLTVTHTLQAAIALATRSYDAAQPPSSQNPTLSTFAIYNTRSAALASNPYKPSELVGPHLTAGLAVYNVGSFLDTAASVRDTFNSHREQNYALAMLPALCAEIPPILATPTPVPSAAPILSSFGDLDVRLQRRYCSEVEGAYGGDRGIEVQCLDYWCTLDQLLSDVYVGMWTFRGGLRVEVGYNEVYHTKASIQRFLGGVKDQVEKGLGFCLEAE
ncbi:MAG: hypothetical protein Q9191_000721 [Dirinaria sp. TL-2023a]